MLRPLSSRGLRSRLVLLVLLALLPVVAASTLANLRQRRMALEDFVSGARRTTAAIASDLDRIATNTHELLVLLQGLPEVRDGGPSCTSLLQGLLKVHPFLTNIGMINAGGSPRCVALARDDGPADSEWFRRAVAERDFVVGEGRAQNGTDPRELVFAYPVLRNGTVDGVLFASFGLSWLDRLLAASAVADGAVGNVYDDSGLMLYRSARPTPFIGTRLPQEVRQRIQESDAAGTDAAGLDGVSRRYVVATWRTDAHNPLTLAVGYPTDVAIRPFNRILIVQSLFLALGVIVAVLVVSRAARTLVLGPIESLVAAVARVRAGDLTTRVAPSGGAEIKELSEAFNLTVEALQHGQDLEEQLRHAQRLQAIGQLAGGVAHEFNNMLTVILGNTELLLEERPNRPEYRAIYEAADRSRVLTHQLLAFSRRQLLQPKRSSLNDLVRDGLASLQPLLDARVSVELRLSPTDPHVLVDRIQFAQVLLNVILNARDAIPSGGRLTITTRSVTVLNGSVPGLTDGDYVELEVVDTGVGMDAETLAHALEPFFTTKPFGQGSGLGLSTAYGIVRQSGGELALSSTPGVGTTVRIYLPAVV